MKATVWADRTVQCGVRCHYGGRGALRCVLLYRCRRALLTAVGQTLTLQVDGGLLELLRTLWCADAAVNRHIVNALGNCGYEIVTLQPKAAEVCARVLPRTRLVTVPLGAPEEPAQCCRIDWQSQSAVHGTHFIGRSRSACRAVGMRSRSRALHSGNGGALARGGALG